jgi:hypothetical protein
MMRFSPRSTSLSQPDDFKLCDNLIHIGPLRWIFLHHVGHQRFHELETELGWIELVTLKESTQR